MIITLKGANFSTNNINDLLNSYSISYYGNGVSGTPSSRSKDDAGDLTCTLTIADGYTYQSLSVSVGGVTLSSSNYDVVERSNVIQVMVGETAITGNIMINVVTEGSGVVEPEEPTSYTFTINPTPSTATVTLTASGYTQSGNSITVASGTTVNWSVSASGYTTQTGTWTANGSNKTENVVLSASSEGYEVYWISEKLTGNTIGSGQPSSLLGSQFFVIRDETYIAELTGKTVESVAVGLTNKEITNGTIKIYLVDRNNEAPGNWVLKDTITGWAGAGSTVEIKDLNTPFVVPSGYTLGYQGSGTLGAGTVTEGYNRDDYYYSSLTSEEATKITMAPFDVKVSSGNGGSDEVSRWILAEQSGVSHENLELRSMLGTQYFVFDDSASYFSGKTIDKIWFAVQPEKESTFNVEVFLVDLNNTLPTAWELKETITVPANSGGQKLTNTLTTPITVPEGYTIGVHASQASVSGITADSIDNKSLAGHYYATNDAATSTSIEIRSYDFYIQG